VNPVKLVQKNGPVKLGYFWINGFGNVLEKNVVNVFLDSNELHLGEGI